MNNCFRFKASYCAALWMMMAWQPGAMAQVAGEASPSKDKVQELDAVVVSRSSDEEERRRSTVTKTVVGKEELARYGDTTVSDVLKRVPGVTIGGQPGRGGEIRMRGLGRGYTQILLNGEPVAPGFSLDSIAPNLIERIEIQRTATADKSTQAVAGLINIVLKQAIRQNQKDLKLVVSSERGLWSPNIDAQLSDRFENISYSVAGSVRLQKSQLPITINDLGRNSQNQESFQRRSTRIDDFEGVSAMFAPRLNWMPSDKDVVVAESFLHYVDVHSQQSDQRTVLFGPPPQFGDNQFHQTSDTLSMRLRGTWTHTFANTGALDLRLGINGNQRRSDGERQAGYSGQSLNGGIALDRTLQQTTRDNGWVLNGKYTLPLDDGNTFVTGWDSETSRRSDHQVQTDVIALLTPADNRDESFQAQVRRLAVFAQNEWSFGKQWSVYTGLRWEQLQTRSQGSNQDDVNNRAAVLSPILQALWKVPGGQGDQIRFGLSHTYKAPQTRELIGRRFRSFENTPDNPDTQGNPNLKPELAWGIDAAYERHLSDGGIFSASAYQRYLTDVLGTELFQDNDGRWISQSTNRGSAVVRGIELESRINLQRIKPAAPNIDLRGNLARNWSHVSALPGPNNRLAQQAPLVANIGADWRIAGLPLTLGATFGFQNGGWVRTGDNQLVYSSVKRGVDAYALWKLDTKSQIRLSVANVLHQDQIESNQVFMTTGNSVQQTTITQSAPVFRVMLETKL